MKDDRSRPPVAGVIGFSLTMVAVVSAFLLGLAWRVLPPTAWILGSVGTFGISAATIVYVQVVALRQMLPRVLEHVDRRVDERDRQMTEQITELMLGLESIRQSVNRLEGGLRAAVALITRFADTQSDQDLGRFGGDGPRAR